MAEKKYYWLKLEKDYLTSPKIKKLRRIAGGDTFTIIYLKMLLQSVSSEGIITFEGIENSLAEELSLKLDEQLEDVQMTLAYLDTQGLIEKNEDKFLLPEASNRIGSESESAERVRKFREKQKALHGNASVTDVKQISISNSISTSTSIDNSLNSEKKDKDIKHRYGEYKHVLLTDEQYNKLKEEFPNDYEQRIKNLDEAIEIHHYKYSNFYLVIKKWASKEGNSSSNTKMKDSFSKYIDELAEEELKNKTREDDIIICK